MDVAVFKEKVFAKLGGGKEGEKKKAEKKLKFLT